MWHRVLATATVGSMVRMLMEHWGGGIQLGWSNHRGLSGGEDISVSLLKKLSFTASQAEQSASSSCMHFLLDWMTLPYLHLLKCILPSRLTQRLLPHPWIISRFPHLKRLPSFAPMAFCTLPLVTLYLIRLCFYYSYLTLLSQHPLLYV